MPLGLERRQQTGQLHFITFSCYRRLPNLNDAAPKQTLEKFIEKTRRRMAHTSKPARTSGAPFMRSYRMGGSFERSSNRPPKPPLKSHHAPRSQGAVQP